MSVIIKGLNVKESRVDSNGSELRTSIQIPEPGPGGLGMLKVSDIGYVY